MKIALIGSAPSSCSLGPYRDASWAQFTQGKPTHYPPSKHLDETWEIWGCSPGAFGAVPRASRWFELHRWEPGQPWFSPEYCQFLRDFNGPVYTGGSVPEIKNHVVYPLPLVEAQFSAFFLNSSLSLMAALAIMEIEAYRAAHPEHDPRQDVIGFWGVDMSANEEYSRQKPGCWFFILEAVRRGIGLYMPPESDLGCPEPVYGICEWDHSYIKATARMRELNQRISAAQQRFTDAQADLQATAGARDDLNYQIKTWLSPYRLPHGETIFCNGDGLGVTPMPAPQPHAAPANVAPSGAQLADVQPYVGRVNPAPLKPAKKGGRRR